MKKPTLPAIPKILALVVLAAALALGAWWIGMRSAEPTTVTAPALARVRTADLLLTASGEGTLEQTSLPLGFTISGALVQVLGPGETVSAGAVLAALDRQQAELNLQSAQLAWNTLTAPTEQAAIELGIKQDEAALAEAQARYDEVVQGPDVEYYQTLLAIAEREYWQALSAVVSARNSTDKRLQNALPRLKARLTAAEQALEQAKLDLEWAINYQPDPTTALLAEGKLQAASSQLAGQTSALQVISLSDSQPDYQNPDLQKAWANLQFARQTLEATTLIAPFDGTVTQVNAQPGEQLSAFQPLLTLVADEAFTVQFSLDESDYALLSVGDPFVAAPTAYPNLELPGVVTAIAPSISNNAQITVWGEILPNELVVKLLPGMNVEVTVTLARSQDTLLLSSAAIRYAENGSPYVNLLLPDGTFQPTPVTLGLSDYANVEILSGLQAGAEVSTAK